MDRSGRYDPPDYYTPKPVGPDNDAYDDAVRFSPYLWTIVDFSFAAVFALLLCECAYLAYTARWRSLRSSMGLRRWVVFGVALAQLVLQLDKLVRDALQMRRMAFLDALGAAWFNFVLGVTADLSRTAVLYVLLRTAMCFGRAWLVPNLRRRYEIAKVFFTASSLAYGVATGLIGFAIMAFVLLSGYDLADPRDAAVDDLVYGAVEIYTLAMDSAFLLLNGLGMLLAVLSWRMVRNVRALRLYFLAATIFHTLFGLRVVIITLRFIYDVRPALYPRRQGFKKPLLSEPDAEFVYVLQYVFDVVLWGALSIAGLLSLAALGRLSPSHLGDDTGLTDALDGGGEYRDDEPQSQPSAPSSREGQLIDVSSDDARQNTDPGDERASQQEETAAA